MIKNNMVLLWFKRSGRQVWGQIWGGRAYRMRPRADNLVPLKSGRMMLARTSCISHHIYTTTNPSEARATALVRFPTESSSWGSKQYIFFGHYARSARITQKVTVRFCSNLDQRTLGGMRRLLFCQKWKFLIFENFPPKKRKKNRQNRQI